MPNCFKGQLLSNAQVQASMLPDVSKLGVHSVDIHHDLIPAFSRRECSTRVNCGELSIVNHLTRQLSFFLESTNLDSLILVFFRGGLEMNAYDSYFSKATAVTFQKGTSDAQKAGIAAALGHIFPVKWKSFVLADGAKAQVIVNKWQGVEGITGMLENVVYIGSPINSNFKMMANEIEAWKVGAKAFEIRGQTQLPVSRNVTNSLLERKVRIM